MKNYLLCLVLFFAACQSQPKNDTDNNTGPHYDLSGVEMEMTKDEVVKAAGEPTAKEDLGSSTDEDGNNTHIELWKYGSKMQISFNNNLVSGIDTDMAATRKRFQQIMDSAREAEGNNQPVIQPN